jgi:hypothetical protein
MTTIFDYFKPETSPTLLDHGLPDPEPRHYLQDPKLRVQAWTITFRKRHHRTDPKVLHKHVTNGIRQLFSKTKSPIYIELHSELTKANVLHYHGLVVGTPYLCARLSAHVRKQYGHILIKTPKKIAGWMEYCNKENLLPVFKYGVKRSRISLRKAQRRDTSKIKNEIVTRPEVAAPKTGSV